MEVLPFESRYYNRRGAGEISGGGERNQEREEIRRRETRRLSAGGCVRCVLPFATLLLRLQLIGRMHWPHAVAAAAAINAGHAGVSFRPLSAHP